MNIDWIKLRPFNGDIKNGFEELVCQLARAENIKEKQQFIRVAAPDGGVEAYCILTNGDEYGWQAKFFSSIGKSQWTQLDDSFKQAFAKHPNLKKYYICTPLDRQDPQIANEKWFMDKWKEKVADWEAFASASGRKLEFEYWGNSELFDRLNKPENEGKLYYWFGQEEFSDNWFKQKLEESILNLGKRYTPEISFDLPVAKVFEGLSRDEFFKKQFLLYLDDLLKKYNQAISHVKVDEVKDSIQKIDSLINEFKKSLERIDFEEISIINQEELTKVLKTCAEVIDNLIDIFYELDSKKKKENNEKKNFSSETNSYGWDIDHFRKFRNSIFEFIEFQDDLIVDLSNDPFLILLGEAGIGKSHLLADVAKKREARNQFTILLLGQQFSTAEDPWSQIIKLLQIECKRDTFLSALNSKAESTGARVLIFIDAINEGQGKAIWMNHMASFISVIKRFPNLGIVFSLRTSYEKLLIPDLVKEKNQATRITHYGFANHEYEASKLFFENYNIKQPSIPLLHPEFSNPLFLKLFCVGLHEKGLHEIPDGYEGISTIINFFLETINDKISDKHNQPRKLRIVQKVVRQIAERVVDTNNSYIKYGDAFSFVVDMKEMKAVTDKSQFFQDLISEGLLTQNVYWDKERNHFEGIYISYERFSDHLIASHLLAKYLNKKNPKKSFSKDIKFVKFIKYIATKIGISVEPKKLFEILKTENTANYNRGIIEALSIQLPEQINLELYEVAPNAREFEPVVSAFIESIIWRKKETLSDKHLDYINQVVIAKYNYHFINTILLVTSQPQNYFNSDFFHDHLWTFSMAERDSWWTQFIHSEYSEAASPIKRMIDWGWTNYNRETYSAESIRLLCQTMIWLFTSCNRTLRDSATKAIICLLQERIDVLIQLIKTFKKVNDPYVLQRVYAVAFGCAVRTNKIESLKELGIYIYESVFNTENVIPDILLRDYARGIIDYAVFKGHKFDFDLSKIEPPFKSEFPETFPTNEETDKFKFNYEDKDFKKHQGSQNSILSSMITEYGRKGGMYGDFGRYVFQSGLSRWRVDVNGLSNLAIKWIIEKYGYDIEKHGEFDRNIGYKGRHSHKVERIGKKYQWIAFYEILARVSDNYPFYENSYSKNAKPIKYEGPWEPYVRDIDPTITIKGNSKNQSKTNWWNPFEYSCWDIQNKEWIMRKDDLPNPQSLVCVSDKEGIEWLVLERYYDWKEPTRLGEEDYKNPYKRLYYNLSTYVIHKKDLQNIIEYLTNKNVRNCGLSEIRYRYQIFSREYYWSTASKTFNSEYYGGTEWNELHNSLSDEYVCDTAPTAITHSWEEEFDASKEETISFYKPTELLFKLLGLEYSREEGQFVDKKGEMICFDPSATYNSPSCLLVRKLDLLKVLAENDLEIIWTSMGEKTVIGGNFQGNDYVGRMNISDVIYFESETLKHASHYEME